jgi:A/G-specific adenine glycosylase
MSFLWETAKEEEFDFVAEQIKTDYYNELLSVMACNEKSIIHKLSHQHLFKFWKVSVRGGGKRNK